MGKLLALIMLATLLKLATACAAPESSAGGGVETAPALCATQGEGFYTFAMQTSLTTLGLPDSTVQSVSFQIMDNGCNILGTYPVPNCDLPWTIEDSFLQYVLTITSIDEEADDQAYFSFTYANGAYSIGNNGCGCSSVSDTLGAASTGCKCAFPVAGLPSKREISFQA